MSITLVTGVPGSGKSVLAMTIMLEKMEEGRPLFVHGVPDLSLEHTRVICSSPTCDVCPQPPVYPIEPVLVSSSDFDSWSADAQSSYENDYLEEKQFYERELKKYNVLKSEFDKYLLADDWNIWAPDGALIFYDEVQNVYRPRSSSSKVPHSVSAFETHRHKGIDFYLVTQSPLLFDGNIRRLVGRHIHLRPTWAGRYQYEFPECNDNTRSLGSGVKSKYKLNKDVFKLYTSSSLHTKQSRSIPFIAYFFVFVIFLLGLLAFRLNTRFNPSLSPSQNVIQTSDDLSLVSPPPPILAPTVSTSPSFPVLTVRDLIKKSYQFLTFEDLEKLPDFCQFYSNSVKCYVPSSVVYLFKSYVCISDSCFSLIPIQNDLNDNEFNDYGSNKLGVAMNATQGA